MNNATIKLEDVEASFVLNKKKFRSGSRGYHGFGKMQVGEKRYQVNLILVEIGSKP